MTGLINRSRNAFMKGMVVNKMKNIVKITAGVLMLVCVLIGYIPEPEYVVELTCISNTVGGLLLIADGIFGITKKGKLPNALYLNVTVCILMVFLVCMGSLTGIYRFNFKGAFFFLHVVNPLVFLACYMLFVDEKQHKVKYALTAPIMSMVYFLFDYIRCQFTGEFVYGFVSPEELTLFYAIITGVILYLFIALLGLGLFTLNRITHRFFLETKPEAAKTNGAG